MSLWPWEALGRAISCFAPELSRGSGGGDHSTGLRRKLAFALWLCPHVLLTLMWKLLGPCDRSWWQRPKGALGRRWGKAVADPGGLPDSQPLLPCPTASQAGSGRNHCKLALGDGPAGPASPGKAAPTPVGISIPCSHQQPIRQQVLKVDTPLGTALNQAQQVCV